MKTDPSQPQFWMLEDVQLRVQSAADAMDRATQIFPRLSRELRTPEQRQTFDRIERDVGTFAKVARSYQYHLRETNIAQMLRQDIASGRPLTGHLVAEMDGTLNRDVQNQGGRGRVVEMRRLFRENPGDFVQHYLTVPDDVSGQRDDFNLTTR